MPQWRRKQITGCSHSTSYCSGEINLDEIISFLLPNGMFFYLRLVKAGLGRFNIRVMEKGKKSNNFLLDIWKPDGKPLLREILSWLTVFLVLLHRLRKAGLCFYVVYLFPPHCHKASCLQECNHKKLEAETNGWLKQENSWGMKVSLLCKYPQWNNKTEKTKTVICI